MLEASSDSLESWRDEFPVLFYNTFAELDRVVQTLADVVEARDFGEVTSSRVT